MGFSDILYLVLVMFVIVVAVLSADYVQNSLLTSSSVSGKIPAAVNQSVTESWTANITFVDSSLAAIFFIFAAISIGLTIFLSSHPIMLVAWLFFNILVLFVWDILDDFLTKFLATDLNTGRLSTATAFLQNDLPKGVVVVNILLGAVLFGKRVLP